MDEQIKPVARFVSDLSCGGGGWCVGVMREAKSTDEDRDEWYVKYADHQQSIDALRAEVERLQSSYDQLYVHAESSYQARNEAEAEAEALRKALSYALWQHNGGGSPIHNHWSAVAANTLDEIDAARKGAE